MGGEVVCLKGYTIGRTAVILRAARCLLEAVRNDGSSCRWRSERTALQKAACQLAFWAVAFTS